MRYKHVPFLLVLLLLSAAGCAPREESGTSEAGRPAEAADNGAPEAEQPAEPEAVPAEELIWVYRSRGNRQCENGGTSLQQSSDALTGAGVAVQESRCGTRTDRMYPSVCGGQTGDILLHLVGRDGLDSALQQGYDPADNIEYQQASCPGGGN